MRKLTLVIILIAIYSGTTAQLKKNVVYATAGTIIFAGGVNANYERQLFRNQLNSMSIWIRIGYGFYYQYSYGAIENHLIGITMLKGTNSKHFELNLSYANFQISPDFLKSDGVLGIYSNHSIAGSIGYRYQKPNGNFIFRTGAGYPETLYISFGFCFGK